MRFEVNDMNGTTLNKDDAPHALAKNKNERLLAFGELAEAAITRDGKFFDIEQID